MSDEQEQDKERLRKLAKKRLEGKSLSLAPSEKDASELIEELSLHQEELNIQNEELRRIQVELEASKAKYFQLYDLAPVGYITLTPDLIIKESNLAAAIILGTERKNLINKALSSFVSPQSQEALYLHYRRLSERKEKQVYTFQVRTKNGKELLVQFESNLIEGETSKGFRSILADVTERKRAEETLRQSEVRFRSLIEGAPVAIAMSRNGFTTYCNPRYLKLFGYPSDKELYGRPFIEQIALEDRERALESARGTEEGSANEVDMELLGVRKDGSQFPFHAAVTLLDLNDGPALLGFFTDITERKMAEKGLRESQEDLNHAQFVSHTGSWRLNMQLNELLWSDEAYRMFGIPKGTPMTYDAFLDTIYQEDRAYVDGKWQAALRGEPYDIEHRIVVNGEIRWVRERAELEFDEDGALQGGFGTVQDITERKKAEADLRRSNDELRQFAYVASHDLQEPLRMVAAYLSRLEEKYGDQLDGTAKEYMDFAIEGGLRAKDLVQDLLEFSRIDSQAKPFQPTNMERVLEQVMTGLAIQIEEEHATLTHDELPTVLADDSQMVQVMQNLISNAIKFHGPEPPNVHISFVDRDQEWLFSVKDNGIGIDPRYEDKLFIIFQRLHARSKYPGTGIGLAISKKIVERHGGRIWFYSQVGQGTTFYFTIPKGRRT